MLLYKIIANVLLTMLRCAQHLTVNGINLIYIKSKRIVLKSYTNNTTCIIN